MGKHFLLAGLFLSLIGCGQKSTIKNAPESKTISQTVNASKLSTEVENDGRYVPLTFSVSITPDPVLSALPEVGIAKPAASFLARVLMKAGLDLGTKKFTLNQPVPDLPEEFIQSAHLSRIFFIIEGDKIDFVKKLAVLVTPKQIRNENDSMNTSPADEVKMSKEEKRRYLSLFEPGSIHAQMHGLDAEKEVMIVKYDRDRNEGLSTVNHDHVYLIETNNPAGVFEYIRNTLDFEDKKYLKHIEQMSDAVLVELRPRKDINLKSIFEHEMRTASTMSDLGFKKMTDCDPKKRAGTCVDLRLPTDFNILPLVLKENSIQLDAFVEVDRVPKEFKVRGYIKFSANVKDPLIEKDL